MNILPSERLKRVYSLSSRIENKNRIIDVGSDHGYLVAHALISGDYKLGAATDINEAPYLRTRGYLKELDLESKASCYHTDGLKGVELMPHDTIVMAGLGGNNMIDIIAEAMKDTPYEVLKTIRLILQPQKTIEGLRVFLAATGFNIEEEDVISEKGFFYPMLRCSFDGIRRELTLEEKYFGPILIKSLLEKDISEYYRHLLRVYEVKSRGDDEIRNLLANHKVL